MRRIDDCETTCSLVNGALSRAVLRAHQPSDELCEVIMGGRAPRVGRQTIRSGKACAIRRAAQSMSEGDVALAAMSTR